MISSYSAYRKRHFSNQSPLKLFFLRVCPQTSLNFYTVMPLLEEMDASYQDEIHGLETPYALKRLCSMDVQWTVRKKLGLLEFHCRFNAFAGLNTTLKKCCFAVKHQVECQIQCLVRYRGKKTDLVQKGTATFYKGSQYLHFAYIHREWNRHPSTSNLMNVKSPRDWSYLSESEYCIVEYFTWGYLVNDLYHSRLVSSVHGYIFRNVCINQSGTCV